MSISKSIETESLNSPLGKYHDATINIYYSVLLIMIDATSLYWFEKPILYLPTVITDIFYIENLNRPSSVYEKIYLCCHFLYSQNLVVL